MGRVLRPDSPIPVLILTDEDYRRAFAPDGTDRAAVVAAPAEPEIAPPPRRRRSGVMVAAAVVLVASGAALWLSRGVPTSPATAPVAAAPRIVPPPVKVEPAPAILDVPPSRPKVAVPPEPEIDDDVARAPDPPPPPPKAPWCGGRAWVTLRLRMDRGSQVQECERRVTIVEEGSRYILERSAAQSGDVWVDRLALLLQLPDEDESWHRRITLTRAETVHLQKGDVACRVVEGEDRFPQGVRRFRYWYSDEFPAGALQAEQALGDLVFACRVLDFSPAPSRKP